MRVRKALPWLGWALAGVLALGVGGNALAGGLGGGYEVAAGPAKGVGAADPAAAVGKADTGDRAFRPRRGLGRFGKRFPIHGEVTVRTKDDKFELFAFARGEVTAVSATSLSIRSADGVVTRFALNGDTRYRKLRDQAKLADVKVGLRVIAAGPKSSAGTITARHVLIRPERAPKPPATGTP
jgi:hypothetical protein